ncbi:glycosyltransferase family 2 protein [Ferrimicrobium acidiphilum]|uniref:Glycosyltransferase n=2 Tax=Ferrimicrobium TaxID=121038 RepID=A0ABV3Y464_9ACTN
MTPSQRRVRPAPSKVTELRGAQVLSEVDYLHLVLDNRTIERDDLGRQIAERNAQLAQMHASTSWRVTKGLRLLSQGVKSQVVPRLAGELQRNPQLGALARRLRLVDDNPATTIERVSTAGVQSDLSADEIDELDIEPYLKWVREYDSVIDEGAIHAYTARLSLQPTISIVMPTYNSPIVYLREAIESVRSQIYANWQLCIVDDGSITPEVHEVINEYVAADHRIVAHFRTHTGNIAAATNDGIAMAIGDYVAFLDHDDLLRPHSLAWVVATINEHPDAVVLYSDEDKLTWDGRRFSPYFKPDFDPLLLLAQNYMTHFFVARRSELWQIGGLRVGLDGAQDWDLALRITEVVREDQIRHIPAILYHWRMIEGSTAIRVQLKPEAMHAGTRAVEEALERRGIDARLELVLNESYHLVHFKPTGTPHVAIVIPTRNHGDLLEQCLRSLESTNYPDYEVIVINNESDEPEMLALLAQIASRQRHRVFDYPHPFNYAAMHNWAIAQIDADYICMLNNDTEVLNASWLTDMVGLAQQDNIAAVGALLWYPDHTVQHAGVVLGINGEAGHRYKLSRDNEYGHGGRIVLAQRLSAVTGAAMLVSKAAFDKVEGFDEEFTVSLNDIDLCLQLTEAGYHIGYTPAAQLIHHESKSRGMDTEPSKKGRYGTEVIRYWHKWAPRILNDPYHNPNASIDDVGCGAAWPPRVRVPWLASSVGVELPCPRPARYFPSNPILLEPGAKIECRLDIPSGVLTSLDRVTIWAMETKPYATDPHRLWIGESTTATIPSWLHLDPVRIALVSSAAHAPASITLRHEGKTPLLIEAVTINRQLALRVGVESLQRH